MSAILEVNSLTVVFETQRGFVTANEGVSFSQGKGEWLAIMGPSGSGKSVLAKTISGIFTGSPGVVAGRIAYKGSDLLDGIDRHVRLKKEGSRIVGVRKDQQRWEKVYRRNIARHAMNQFAYIFQNPYDALNPYCTVRKHLREALRAGGTAKGEIGERSIDLLTTLQIASPADTLKRYPHELSGGMAQRVVIAMALAQKTSVIIADECTTSLDPVSAVSTVEALQSARQTSGCSILFITHDEGIAVTYSDRILRFDKGRFVNGGSFS